MKIYGIFRGFPGLGRVVSGVSLLKSLEEKGHQIKAYSYLQGKKLLEEEGIKSIIEKEPLERHIMVIGLNPISKESGELIESIVKENPDLVIIDGEPLLTSTLSLVFPKERICSLVNPTDLVNPSLPESSILFYRKHYMDAGTVLVHNVTQDSYQDLGERYQTNLCVLPTILRPEILKLNMSKEKKYIVSILGGGTVNSSENFIRSTCKILELIIKVAKKMPEELFKIYCNDKNIKEKVSIELPDNVEIIAEYTKPATMYQEAKVVLCRAGRNTISELLYLGIPSLLFASSGDFRSVEQNKNIKETSINSQRVVDSSHIEESAEKIVEKLQNLLTIGWSKERFKPGNAKALEKIEEVLEKYGKKNNI